MAEQNEVDEEVQTLMEHSNNKVSELAKKIMNTYFTPYEQHELINDPAEPSDTFKI
jgi:hypothetical protein